MPEYLAPGVFVEEASKRPKPIEGVPTSTAAFIGETARGQLEPTLIESYDEYLDLYGDIFHPTKYMPYSVRAFFHNGGQRCYVARVVGSTAGAEPTVTDFEGRKDTDPPTGINAFELDEFQDAAIMHIPHPGTHANAIYQAMIRHCERQRFRFGVIDCDPAQPDAARIDPRTDLGDSSYAAFYYPWLYITDPQSGDRKLVPPGGAVCGVYALTDNTRGVWKAPANASVAAIDVEFNIDHNQQEILNPRGVNCLRRFPGEGILIWGARTLASDPEWKYVSVRRLFIFLESSIYQGTQWTLFEPNDQSLWERIKETVTLFLRVQWRAGALAGAKEEETFFVKVGRETMTQDDIDDGRLIVEIGIAPVRPAEFVIFRIFQKTLEASDLR